jgi:hypothetical protein
MYSHDKDSSCSGAEGTAFSSVTSNRNTRAYSNILTAIYFLRLMLKALSLEDKW